MARLRTDQTDVAAQAQEDAPMGEAGPAVAISPEEDIPPFNHLISAIFVPLKQDLLKPIEPSKDRVERLQRMQASLDANEKAVRDNLAWTCEREARRCLAQAKRTRPLAEPHEPRQISWDEGEKMLANMSARASPSHLGHIPPETLAQFGAPIEPAIPEHLTPHERTVREVLFVASHGSFQMERYSEDHIKPIRERLNASLEREKKRV